MADTDGISYHFKNLNRQVFIYIKKIKKCLK